MTQKVNLFWGRTAIITAPTIISLVCTIASAFMPLSTYNPVNHFRTSIRLASTSVPREKSILRMGSSVDGCPRTGDVVTIKYSLTPNDDFVPTPLFDSGDDIRFILNKGNYLPAIHTSESNVFHPFIIQSGRIICDIYRGNGVYGIEFRNL